MTGVERGQSSGAALYLGRLADYAVTAHRGPGWALDEIYCALDGAETADLLDPPLDLAVCASAARLNARLRAVLPPGIVLDGDRLLGPAQDQAQLARDALWWPAQAGLAEVAADLWAWTPPPAEAVTVEARALHTDPSGRACFAAVAAEDAHCWGVYTIDAEGLALWQADFTDQAQAIRHARRWGAPTSLRDAEWVTELPDAPAPPPGVGAVLDAAAALSDAQVGALADVDDAMFDEQMHRRAYHGAFAALRAAGPPRWQAWRADAQAATASFDALGRRGARSAVRYTLLALHARDLLADSSRTADWTPEAYAQLTWPWRHVQGLPRDWTPEAYAQHTWPPQHGPALPCPLPPPNDAARRGPGLRIVRAADAGLGASRAEDPLTDKASPPPAQPPQNGAHR